MFRGVTGLVGSLLGGLLLVFAFPSHALHAAIPTQQSQVVSSFPTQPGLPDPNAIFDAVNHARTAKGLPPLVKDAALSKIAQQRASDMHNQSYYAHKSPHGLFYHDLMYQQDIGSNYSCENLDLQFVPAIDTYVRDWMHSDAGHRECMLNQTTDRAGYAITTLNTANNGGTDVAAYVVVAIHASLN